MYAGVYAGDCTVDNLHRQTDALSVACPPPLSLSATRTRFAACWASVSPSWWARAAARSRRTAGRERTVTIRPSAFPAPVME